MVNTPIYAMDAIFDKFKEMGGKVEKIDDRTVIVGGTAIKPVNIKTSVYPGFPTDMQAQFMSVLSLANGVSVVKETIFENRFQHVAELNRMNANILVSNNQAVINGVEKLKGAKVMATDLRASASLVIAALSAEGTTEILRIYHLDRGYEKIEEKLSKLGASIRREKA
jgi:UDP-N-acetylglucosamine 1-carboxyvinyltransferase